MSREAPLLIRRLHTAVLELVEAETWWAEVKMEAQVSEHRQLLEKLQAARTRYGRIREELQRALEER